MTQDVKFIPSLFSWKLNLSCFSLPGFVNFCVDLIICPIIIQRDGEDMVELVRNCQNEFKEYYIQMQAAKRSQAPNPSQVMRESVEVWNCLFIH